MTPPSLKRLASALDGRVFVEFFPEQGAISALRIDEREARYFPSVISIEETLDVLNRLHLLVFKASRSPQQASGRGSTTDQAMEEMLRRLGAALQPVVAVDGLDGSIGNDASSRRLIIAPHGPLHYLPLHAARIDGVPLCGRAVIEYTPSASVWLHGQRGRSGGAASDGPGSVLLVGPQTGRLPGADQEVRQLAQLFPRATVLTGGEATVDAVLEALPRARVAHFATHCLFRPERPDLSGLELAGGWLRPADLRRLRLSTELVTLSACATGPGRVRSGDEILGMLRGFLTAGAMQVLASLWPVSDKQTTAFMTRFYEDQHRAGMSDEPDEPSRLRSTGAVRPDHRDVAASLRNTLLDSRREGHHPYVWAPFVLYARRRSARSASGN
jgi:hypothetical protein